MEEDKNEQVKIEEKKEEQVNTSEKKETSKSLLIILIIVLVVVTAYSLCKIYSDKTKPIDDDNSGDTTNVIDDKTNGDQVTPSESMFSFDNDYNLTNLEESYAIVDSLSIKFTGTPSTDVENGFTYVAEVTMNGKNIVTGLFEDVNKKVIYSKDYASQFNVKKINNLYILQSKIAAQYGGTYIVVLNQNGEVLLKKSNVKTDFTKVNNEKYLTITNYSENPSDNNSVEEKYLIEENSLILK